MIRGVGQLKNHRGTQRRGCGGWLARSRRRGRKVNNRTRAGPSFFQTRIHTDLRRFELEEGENHELACSRSFPKNLWAYLR